VLTCALFLNATPVSIFNDVTNASDDYYEFVVDEGPTGASFSTGGTAYNLTTVVVELSNDSEEDARAANRSGRMRSRHASVRSAQVKAKPSKIRKAGDPAPSVTVALWSDNGGPGPGTLLATSATTLLDTSLGDSPAPFSFPFSYPLTANTRYWIMVTSPGENSVAVWWGTPDMTGPDVAGEYYTGEGEVTANGAEAGAFRMQVIGDPSTPPPTTPAPASVTLVLIGLGCAAWYFRRKVLRSS
jgi:hypothetical protein